MHILLFICYALLLSFLVTKLPWFHRSPLKMKAILFFFGLHTAVGCAHTWIAWHFFPNHGDIWLFFTESFVTRQELQTSFQVFWADNHRLVDLPHNLIEWMHVILNIASRDNLYINTLLFSFLSLSGYIALFEVWFARLNKDLLAAAAALFLPSVLFWTSCIQTEGIVYPLLGWLLFLLDDPRKTQPSASSQHHILPPSTVLYRIIPAISFTGIIIFMRPAIGIGLLPIPAIWIIYTQMRSPRTRLAAAIFLLTCITAFFMTAGHFLSWLSAKQIEFQQLSGGSKIYLPLLEPNAASLWHALPTAILNGFLQPLPGSIHQSIYFAFFAELTAIWLIIAASLIPRRRRSQTAANTPTPNQSASNPTSSVQSSSNPPTPPKNLNLTTLCLVFSIPCILLVGLIVPFIGAIVRYRSIYLPFLLIPFLHQFTTRIPLLQKTLSKHLLKSPHQNPTSNF